MDHVLILLAALVFTIAFSFRNKWQFRELALTKHTSGAKDEIKKANSRWHTFQGMVKLSFFAMVGVGLWSLISLPATLTYMAVFWILFDGLLNITGLDKPFFYVGKTAFIDKQFRRFKRPQLAMAITKFTCLVGFGIWYVIALI